MKLEFGGYYDNLEVLHFAKRQIRMGRVRKGLKVLRDLRTHIQQTADNKSEKYILPNVTFYEITATVHDGLTSCEAISAYTRSFARKLTLGIARRLRAVRAFATRRHESATAPSSKAIPPIFL